MDRDGLDPTFAYNTNYSWNKPLTSVIDGANISAVKNTAINFSLSGTEIIETFYTPASKRKAITPTTRSRSASGLSRGESEHPIKVKIILIFQRMIRLRKKKKRSLRIVLF